MTVRVVHCDEPLRSAHLLDAEILRCPRGAAVKDWAVRDWYGNPLAQHGHDFYVRRCGLPAGHQSPCEPTAKPRPQMLTRCGLTVSEGPWVYWDDTDTPTCPDCVGGSAHELDLFGAL